MKMSKFIDIIKTREDISDYVYHFAKNDNAKQTLISILSENTVKDINRHGYICFTEAPLTMLPAMFAHFEKFERPMYAPYGIAFKKALFYQNGGRPVIYGDQQDKKLLPKELMWRFEFLYPGTYDFSWLREWRIPLSALQLNSKDCFAIVKTRQDEEGMRDCFFELDDIDFDTQPEDGGQFTEVTGYFNRKMKVVSLEEIKDTTHMSKQQLARLLKEQSNQYGCSLGSIWE